MNERSFTCLMQTNNAKGMSLTGSASRNVEHVSARGNVLSRGAEGAQRLTGNASRGAERVSATGNIL
jgi:hypothetical protein